MRKGFTIVELLMVIGIIGVLMGIVTTAASESVTASRIRRAEALCSLVQAGFNNYYAQYDRWPGAIGDRIANGSIGTRSNNEGTDGSSDTEQYVLTTAEAEDCVLAMIAETKKGNPVMDVSGLFVCSKRTASNVDPVEEFCNCMAGNHRKYLPRGAYGMDFMSAIHGTRKSPQKLSTSQMHFGYPHPDNGRFMPFQVIYSISTDSFTVKRWHWPGVNW